MKDVRVPCVVSVVVAALAACTDPESATDLQPEGPPMILQVRLTEKYLDSANTPRARTVFAFGTHDDAEPEEEHPVTTAVAAANALRIVMDELLVGNHLEEIQCRAIIDDDNFGRVPVGATPDDIADCSVSNDLLRQRCAASKRTAVCLCARPAGCSRAAEMIPQGEPVGVEDRNEDGAADDTRFIAGSVGIQCGATAVPIHLDNSYWNPSGTQNAPADGGFDALGPAIVLAPQGPLPTGATCGLTFGQAVVDKQGERVCAPPNGDSETGCEAGELAAFSFGVEPLAIDPGFRDGDTGVSRASISLTASAPVALASLANIQFAPALAGAVTYAVNATSIQATFATPLASRTMYTVTIPVTVTDTFGQPLPAVKTFRFTTGG